METYRLIRNADWIVTMDEHRSRYRHADLIYKGNEIVARGTASGGGMALPFAGLTRSAMPPARS